MTDWLAVVVDGETQALLEAQTELALTQAQAQKRELELTQAQIRQKARADRQGEQQSPAPPWDSPISGVRDPFPAVQEQIAPTGSAPTDQDAKASAARQGERSFSKEQDARFVSDVQGDGLPLLQQLEQTQAQLRQLRSAPVSSTLREGGPQAALAAGLRAGENPAETGLLRQGIPLGAQDTPLVQAEQVDRAFRRDSRRYDGGFSLQ